MISAFRGALNLRLENELNLNEIDNLSDADRGELTLAAVGAIHEALAEIRMRHECEADEGEPAPRVFDPRPNRGPHGPGRRMR